MSLRNKAKKKLIFFVLPLKFFISHRLPIAIQAQKEGYEIHIISTSCKEKTFIEEKGFIFHELNIRRKSANPFFELKAICNLYTLYRKINPDIVHHITIKPLLYGTLAAKFAGIKAIVNAFSGLGYIFTASGFKAAILRNSIKLAYRFILRHPNLRTIVQNRDDMNYLISESIVRKEQTVLIKGSGVDLDKFKPFPEPIGTPIVILPSRLLKDKGVIEFVDASNLLRNSNIKVRMVLIGEVDTGNPTSVNQEVINSWLKEGVIECWGYRKDMPVIISQCNLVCLPSYREGLPKALIEATASGRAIITTDVPGCREMIDSDNPNGILVQPRDPMSLANAIEKLINNPDLRHQMALNGRKMAERNFSIDLVVQKTMNIYSKLLD